VEESGQNARESQTEDGESQRKNLALGKAGLELPEKEVLGEVDIGKKREEKTEEGAPNSLKTKNSTGLGGALCTKRPANRCKRSKKKKKRGNIAEKKRGTKKSGRCDGREKHFKRKSAI